MLERCAWAGSAVLAAALSGCGTPGAPQPPSLHLPSPVNNLSAERDGSHVTLHWTMPRRTTDRELLKADVTAQVCLREGAGPCVAVGPDTMLAPGAAASATETLPQALTEGAPRAVAYCVELKNRKGRSAGVSNAAWIVAGRAPAPVTGLVAEVRKSGVVLHWTTDGGLAPVRLHRTLLNPQAKNEKRHDAGLLTPGPEPERQSLLVEDGLSQGRALDKSIRFGGSYEYRAQRVERVTVEGHALELAGALSDPVRVDAEDVFPPAVPAALVTVATAASEGASAAIDLSWQPDTDPDLAGYVVYRSEDGGAWKRISSAEPLPGAAFHDTAIERGHTYAYTVSAVDRAGHESTRSAVACETAQ